jgi:hypothetical protein
LGGRGRRISEFEASLSSRTARDTQRNPVLKRRKKKKKKAKVKNMSKLSAGKGYEINTWSYIFICIF